MATLVIGDVHGCRDELEALLDESGADEIFLVGDLYTKGPDPGGVWELVRDRRMRSVLGNHDDRLVAFVEGRRPDDDGAHRTAAALDRIDPERGWLEHLRSLPLFEFVGDWTIVHACIDNSGSLEQTTRAMALTWRRWPGDDPTSPPWHRVYAGDRRVIFGHDARGGLVRVERDGAPWLLGLDTGCVYGGKLSGYLVDEDRVVQVDARRTHRRP